MKLTDKDKSYLLSIGYHQVDLATIEKIGKNIRCVLCFSEDNKPEIKLTQNQAIGILGRETFLSGIGRATFHQTAMRTTDSIKDIKVYFESK